ncbi:MAG: response regulator transcription factor [Ferruginibacter sp.]
MKKISVFIVDDHYMVIEGIRSLLQHEDGIEWTGHATSAESCLAFLKNRQPDVVLMDINLPDTSGIELCKKVKELYPKVMILGLSTFNQFSFIEKMIANGASGYALKNADKAELLEAIRLISKGKTYLSHEASQTLRKPKEAGVILTRREKEILELIAEGKTNTEIANELFISVNTVDTHRKNLLAKFDAKNTANLVRNAMDLKLL